MFLKIEDNLDNKSNSNFSLNTAKLLALLVPATVLGSSLSANAQPKDQPSVKPAAINNESCSPNCVENPVIQRANTKPVTLETPKIDAVKVSPTVIDSKIIRIRDGRINQVVPMN
jgi:hypothetical protein